MLTDKQDAFGHEIRDYWEGRGGYEIIERDDGYFSPSSGPAMYFQEYADWSPYEREAMQYARGRILDLGCGAGRHSLYLQSLGHEVTGIDSSPLAISVCRSRGLKDARVLPVTRVSRRMGVFDTILMMGNNFSLMGNPKRARWLLRRFFQMISSDGRMIAQTRNPYETKDPEHLAYHARNRDRARWGGEARIRVRYKRFATPWIDFLMVAPAEMEILLDGTGWKTCRRIDGEEGLYAAILGRR